MIIEGGKIIIKVNGTAIAAAKSCEINVNCDEVERTSASQQSWREFLAGRKEWTVTCTHLVTSYSGAPGSGVKKSIEMIGTAVTLTIELSVSDSMTGSALVKTWRASAVKHSLAQGSFSFRGNGPLI